MNLEKKIAFQNKHWGAGSFDTFPTKRQAYQKIWADIDTNPIALITGPRRIGKSVLIKQLINGLILNKSVSPKQILFFEFSPNDKKDVIWEVFNYFTKEVANPTLPIYIFFDEIQYVDEYESVVKNIYDNTQKCKMFLSGSLSLSYKRKMNESLAGRFFTYRLFPLNFSEYLELSNKKPIEIPKDKFERENYLSVLNADFRNFLEFGRFPEIINFNKDQAKAYISNVISQSLNQDAFSYFNIEKPMVINSLFEYFQKNNGAEVSVNKLAKDMGINNQTITLYINILEQMNLIYIVYNSTNPLIKTKSSKKIYISSSFYLLNPKHDIQTSIGFAVESYILERLLEKGEVATFWRNRNKEIDFLIPNKKIGYEIKFRNEVKHLKMDLPGFDLKIISLNGTLPACVF